MTIELLERGASALGPLLEEVVFVGAATVTLWVTDPAAPAPRPTKDVDVIIEARSRLALHDFEARLRSQGFREDASSRVICRWNFDDGLDQPLILDAMPADTSLMGFVNHWQSAGLPHAVQRHLPSGTAIRAISPPYLMATKLEAFRGRGVGDHLGSHDLEDVVLLIDGREALVEEVRSAATETRAFLASQCAALLEEPRFVDAIFGFLRPDDANQERAGRIVFPRLRAIADM